MINPWFKFYGGEYLSDPKIGALTPQERSCWITLLCLAGTSSISGVIEYLTVEVLLEKSGIRFDPYHPNEWDSCLSILTKFEKMKMIVANDNGTVEILNWLKRQEHTMSATERSRKYRAKSREKTEYATSATKCNENATLEENRIEKNRINGNNITSANATAKTFHKPTLEEVTKYCSERKNKVNPQGWIDHYKSNGWMVGRTSMKDWKAAVRTWERNGFAINKKVDNVLDQGHKHRNAALQHAENNTLKV